MDTPTTQARPLLLNLQQQLQQRLAKVQQDLQAAHETDSTEQAQQRENDEVLTDLAGHLQTELLQVHMALEREAAGQYGVCVACGDDISDSRLRIVPFASHCQHCAH